jgi:hypothetical protein
MSEQVINDHLVCIVGESSGGKSASLRNLLNQEGVLYLNCEAGKRLPFVNKFMNVNITDPKIITAYFEQIEEKDEFHTIVIDSQTFMMDMYESVHVLGPGCPQGKNGPDTMKGWGNYAQFFKNLMQYSVAKSTKNVIFTAHVHSIMNEESAIIEKCIPVKGSLAKNGIEAFFSTIVAAKKMPITQLEGYESPLLNITEEEKAIGVKYVFQTRLTKTTVNERIRSNMGMWAVNETFIDNDAQLLLERLKEYYG